jgi:hypothetical protein
LRDDLAAVDAYISGCRDKVRNANAGYFRAKKNREEELMCWYEKRVKEATLTLEENLKKRDQLIAQLPRPATIAAPVRDAELVAPWWMAL